MKPEEKKIYDDFVTRLDGKEAGGKPGFKDFVSAAKSLPRLNLPQKAKDELRTMMGEKFGREDGAKPKAPQRKVTEQSLSEATAAQGLPEPAPVSRQPVYGGIDDGTLAKLEFLAQAIENNVTVIHGLKAAHDANPSSDVSEIQESINHLNTLNHQYNDEVNRIMETVFAGPKKTTKTAGFAPPPVVPPAPTPPSPPAPTALATNRPIGFRREQTAPDPHEVAMLERTKPTHIKAGGGFKTE